MPQKQVAVAMSGGMDSAVAAALLKSQGYQVIGVTMHLSDSEKGSDAMENAERVANKLTIPHHVMDFGNPFAQKVIAHFVKEYSLGRTPNPCIACNQYIKFGLLLNKVRQMGADYLATGHYARVEPCPSGYRLLKAIDHSKDQSYFLYTLGQEQLQYLLLPMGNLYKSLARRMARELGLANTARYESQDICFIPDNDYRSFIAEHIPSQPGDITDTNGKILGKHKGLAYYTEGQRQGLGLASDKRLYVLKLDAKSNRLVVGSHGQLSSNKLVASQLNWISGKAPEDSNNITAKVRYKSPEAAASLHLDNGTAEVLFSQPQWAIAPGQAVVFYQGEAVLGGGIIEALEPTKGVR